MTVAEQLLVFMLSGCLSRTPTTAFSFWYRTTVIFFVFVVLKNRLTRDIGPESYFNRLSFIFKKTSSPICRIRYHHSPCTNSCNSYNSHNRQTNKNFHIIFCINKVIISSNIKLELFRGNFMKDNFMNFR